MTQKPLEFVTPAGLYTDPNPLGDAPPGALRTATNVVLRRRGLLTRRPSFDQVSFASAPANYVPKRLIPFQGAILVIAKNNSSAWRADWRSSEAQMTLPTDATAFRDNWQRAAVSRGHLYLASSGRVIRVRTSGASTCTALSSPPLEMSFVAVSGSLVADGEQIAVRAAVTRRLTASGSAEEFLTLTAPTQRHVFENTAGAGRTLTVTVRNLGVYAAGDIVRIYRTALGTSYPGDEVMFCHEHELTSSDISATTYAHTLDALDAELGAALYTNESQEGRLQANYAPPSSRDVALFRGSTFYANTKQPHRLTIGYVSGSSVTTDKTASATGIGARTYTGDITSGSPTILNASSTVGLKVGMTITAAAFATGTYVTAIVGTTITASANSSATTVGASLQFNDAIHIKRGGTTERFTQQGLTTTTDDVVLRINSGSSSFTSTLAYARADYDRQSLSTASVGPVTVVLEARGVMDAAFEVMATHGDEYTPALPEPSVGTGLSSTQETQPNVLWWSKTDEPEHVPTVNYALVGDRSNILAIVPTRDVLWIFKSDGIYRLTGYGAVSGWQVDPIDLASVLLHPEMACVVGDDCYAATDHGVLRVSDRGIEDVSTDAIGYDLRFFENVTAVQNLDTTEVAGWMASNEKHDEVLVSYPYTSPIATPYLGIYVHNVRTRAWTSWEFADGGFAGPAHVATESTSVLCFASYTTPYMFRREITEGEAPNSLHAQYDNFLSFTINSISGNQITIAGGSGWTPAVGDGIYDATGSTYATVASVASSTVFTVDAIGGIVTGSTAAYVAFPCTVEFHARHAGAPHLLKLWYDASWIFTSLEQVYSYAVSFTSSESDTASSVTATLTRSTSQRPRIARYGVPREHARAHVLFPKLTITQGLGAWFLAGIAMDGQITDTRGTRGGS